MITTTSLTPSHTPAYETFLKNHPAALIYHCQEWWEVLRRSYGYQPASLIALEGDTVVGVLPLMRVHGRLKGRRLVSLPFSHHVPVLTSHPDAEKQLLDAAVEMAKAENYAYLEIRSPLTHEHFQPAVLNFVSRLDLTPAEDILYSQCSRSNRRNISLASRAGFELCDSRDFDTFYRLEVETRHRQGAPMYPPRFFHDLAAHLENQVKLYFLNTNGQPVAGMIMLNAGKTAIYGYGNSTSDPEIKKLKPINLLIWEVIKASKNAGYEWFDFGTTPIHHQNLLEFKERYNPVTEELAYSFYLNTRQSLPAIKRDSQRVQTVEKVLQALPRPLFRRLSPLLLREVG